MCGGGDRVGVVSGVIETEAKNLVTDLLSGDSFNDTEWQYAISRLLKSNFALPCDLFLCEDTSRHRYR